MNNAKKRDAPLRMLPVTHPPLIILCTCTRLGVKMHLTRSAESTILVHSAEGEGAWHWQRRASGSKLKTYSSVGAPARPGTPSTIQPIQPIQPFRLLVASNLQQRHSGTASIVPSTSLSVSMSVSVTLQQNVPTSTKIC